jgi:hypothetical protein
MEHQNLSESILDLTSLEQFSGAEKDFTTEIIEKYADNNSDSAQELVLSAKAFQMATLFEANYPEKNS